MPDFRRLYVEGGTYFFTVVTHSRKRILVTSEARPILHSAWLDVANRFPFETIAVCLLPDHIHCIWKLPENDANFSVRWKEIKRLFTRQYQIEYGRNEVLNQSYETRGEAAIWQRRFWEHQIRDERDLNNHIDYIHYNPVKHGFVERVSDWAWSSFHRYVKQGNYVLDWGSAQVPDFGGINANE